ncbi:MAG: MBOAT family protein [Candidatus Cohnella colombiensis]|uniref:MBOAT family protein n=1 Tax=Candidatus Cohnella colombiensis TaxID=3121368 RepID=A0AA95EW10_9BACL|nr:MAG: MBOAT family protein [Cohnella sp.]
MVFSSPLFLFVFLPLVLAGYFFIRRDMRNFLLLAASLFFYAWGEPRFVWLMIVSILMNYIFGLIIGAYSNKRAIAKGIVVTAVLVNVGILVFYKYLSFIVDNLNRLLESLGMNPFDVTPVDLPIGISFFSFHVISYIVDIYRNDSTPQKNPLNLALYISFFPQLIAGPIIRYKSIAEQIRARTVRMEDFDQGIKRFVMGLSKKVLIANPLGQTADNIFSLSGGDLSSGLAWLGIVCYSFQLYYDFSGYSDMAIGLARMFGFHFPENFNYPYISHSIQEFWRRWHISLSAWFRDYVYIPLGGSRTTRLKTYRNLGIVFLITGIWHGASWNFVIWGAWHGCFLIAERTVIGDFLRKVWTPVRFLYAALVVLVGWVFFRSDTLSQALHYLGSMWIPWRQGPGLYGVAYFVNPQIVILLGIAIIGATPLPKRIAEWMVGYLEAKPLQMGYEWVTSLYILAILLLSIMSLATSTYNPFIYFRF